MYGKLFEQTFTGSMVGAGAEIFAVWAYAIANSKPYDKGISGGYVDINPDIVAVLIGITPEQVDRAVKFLCAPDPRSRTKTNDGRRLLRRGEFEYEIVNFKQYRDIRNEEERKTYKREWDRKNRSRKKSDSDTIRHYPTNPTKTETETETETEYKKLLRKFDIFWSQYPRKISKGQAEKTWLKLKPSDTLMNTMLHALEKRKKSGTWADDKFIPYPSTWLNAKGWEDEIKEKKSGWAGMPRLDKE